MTSPEVCAAQTGQNVQDSSCIEAETIKRQCSRPNYKPFSVKRLQRLIRRVQKGRQHRAKCLPRSPVQKHPHSPCPTGTFQVLPATVTHMDDLGGMPVEDFEGMMEDYRRGLGHPDVTGHKDLLKVPPQPKAFQQGPQPLIPVRDGDAGHRQGLQPFQSWKHILMDLPAFRILEPSIDCLEHAFRKCVHPKGLRNQFTPRMTRIVKVATFPPCIQKTPVQAFGFPDETILPAHPCIDMTHRGPWLDQGAPDIQADHDSVETSH